MRTLIRLLTISIFALTKVTATTAQTGFSGLKAEAVCFENCCQVALSFKLLEPKFGERKQAVDNFLHHFGAIIDTSNGFSLEATEACLGSDCGDCGESENRDS